MNTVELINFTTNHQSFLEQLYRTTREQELQQTGWTELQKQQFVLMQFLAQKADYERKFPDAVQQIVLHKQQPAGRLYTCSTDTNIHLIDISLLPKFQGKGIGTYLLNNLLAKAQNHNKTVSLQVLKDNPAKHLYERLGFIITEEAGLRYNMQHL